MQQDLSPSTPNPLSSSLPLFLTRPCQCQVHAAYSSCKQRLILLDVDLIIRPKEEMGETSKQQFISSLEHLVSERGNYVFLLSSETSDNLLKWLGNMRGLNEVSLPILSLLLTAT